MAVQRDASQCFTMMFLLFSSTHPLSLSADFLFFCLYMLVLIAATLGFLAVRNFIRSIIISNSIRELHWFVTSFSLDFNL